MSRRSILFTTCLTLLTGGLYLSSTTKLKAELVESAQMKWDKRVAELKAAGFDYNLVNHIIALDAEAKGKRLIDDPWLGERLDENAPHKLPDFHSHLKEGISLASESHEK